MKFNMVIVVSVFLSSLFIAAVCQLMVLSLYRHVKDSVLVICSSTYHLISDDDDDVASHSGQNSSSPTRIASNGTNNLTAASL